MFCLNAVDVKYNKPWELAAVVNEAFQPSTEYRENPAS